MLIYLFFIKDNKTSIVKICSYFIFSVIIFLGLEEENYMDLFVYIISDTDGMAMVKLAQNTMDKFDIKYNEKTFTNINSKDNLSKIFTSIKNQSGSKIIFNSLSDPDHNKFLNDFSIKENILTIDYTSYSLNKISNFLGIEPKNDLPLDEDKIAYHYKRLDALDFAIKYDDGRDIKGLKYCDICVIGVSRSSKTPLAVYLASIGYKVINVPILLESRIPGELFEIDSRKIFGLTLDKNRLQKIRQERLKSISLPSDSNYSNIDRIEKEITHAKELMEDLDCNIIDVTYKSIEEISEYIISSIEGIN